MFEKEAEAKAFEKYPVPIKGDSIFLERNLKYEEGFKDGAEFGYNKANEWHYVKDGDYPKNNAKALVLLENKQMKISIFMKNKFTVWNKDYNAYTKLYNIIAWKEIVLPKEKVEE